MPGASPHEAVSAFLAPFHENLSILDGQGQINVNRKGGYAVGEPYAWVVNAGEGMTLPDLGVFFATMNFQVIETGSLERAERYRVTTLGYNYKLAGLAGDLWRFHWHPGGVSTHQAPHVHVPHDYLAYPTNRITFEYAVRWCISAGAKLCVELDEAEAMLATTEYAHQLHRSWSDSPDRRHPGS